MVSRLHAILPTLMCFVLGGVGYHIGASSSERTIKRLRADIAELRSQFDRYSQRSRTELLVESSARLPNSAFKENNVKPEITQDVAARAEILQRRAREEHVARVAKEQQAADAQIFADLGLPADKIAQFQSNKVQLHFLAIDALDPMQTLLEARAKYDREVEGALGKEGYEKYVTHEKSKPAIREYEMLQEYAIAQGQPPLDPVHYQMMVDLIRESGATTTESWHGPYDPPPSPRVGKKMMAEARKNSISHLEESANALLEMLKQRDVPVVHHELVAKYYSSRLEDKRRSLAFLSQSDEEIKAYITRLGEAELNVLKSKTPRK